MKWKEVALALQKIAEDAFSASAEAREAPLTVSGPQTVTEPQTPLETHGKEI